MDKIAIIGTADGQRGLYEKANSAGYYTVGFSWDSSPDFLRTIDKFYNISIVEKDLIVDICRKESVSGVVSNGSELTARISAYVAEQLGLPCTPYQTILNIQNKSWVRERTNNIIGLSPTNYYIYNKELTPTLPCIVKPVTGGGKCGVSYVSEKKDFVEAIKYARDQGECILVEEFVDGLEFSVETISYNRKHYVVQITDKNTSGPPHFVELGHHQPSQLPQNIKFKICEVVPRILDAVGYINGACHVEMKWSNRGLFLIELNPRGGGDMISTKLVEMSTGYDYLLAMIDVAMGRFVFEPIHNIRYAGIYFLTKQTEYMLPFFLSAKRYSWYADSRIYSTELRECLGNAIKDGYLIYNSNQKIIIRNE